MKKPQNLSQTSSVLRSDGTPRRTNGTHEVKTNIGKGRKWILPPAGTENCSCDLKITVGNNTQQFLSEPFAWQSKLQAKGALQIINCGSLSNCFTFIFASVSHLFTQ